MHEPKQPEPRTFTAGCLESALVSRGIREPVAAELVRQRSSTAIRQSLKKYDQMRKRGDDSKLNNPPGLLISWIKEHQGAANDSLLRNAKPAVLEPTTSEGAESQSKFAAIRDYLAKLSPQETESLELVAFEQADSFQLACYERVKNAANARLLSEYRNVIVETHVGRLLGITAE